MIRSPALLYAAALVALIRVDSFGNGGPFSTTAIERTGNLVPTQKKAIKLESEKLNIRFDAERAFVVVVYELRNSGPADDVTFAFPVKLMPPPAKGRGYGYEYNRDDSLKDFHVFDGTREIPVSRRTYKALGAWEKDGSPAKPSPRDLWSVMNLHFNSGEQKILRLSYSVRCAGVIDGLDGDFNWKFTPLNFNYAFSPAAGWGDGRVGKLDIMLDTTFLKERGMKLIRVSPKPETDEPNLKWSFENFDLSTAPDLVCSYDSAPMLFDRRAQSFLSKRGDAGGVTISESISQGDADARPLFDRNLRTAWVASGDKNGIGTKIRVQPGPKTSFTGLAILNGCTASEQEYQAHARIKKIHVDDIWTDDEDVLHHDTYDKDFPDESFNNLSLRFPTSAAKPVLETENPGITRYIEMTVTEIYPGTEHKPLAISEIYVYGEYHAH